VTFRKSAAAVERNAAVEAVDDADGGGGGGGWLVCVCELYGEQ